MQRTTIPAATVAACAAALVAFTGTAGAHEGPTCSTSPLGIDVHGEHVVRDYVIGSATDLGWPIEGVGELTREGGAAVPGGPGPRFHWYDGNTFAPGASFCTDAQSGNAVEHQQASDHVPDVR